MRQTDPTTETPMGEILETLTGARRALFSRYHLGGCQSCAFSNEETLGQLVPALGAAMAEKCWRTCLPAMRMIWKC